MAENKRIDVVNCGEDHELNVFNANQDWRL